MGKIRVVHIITELELGGAQLFTLKTVKELDKEKFETFLIANCKGMLNSEVKNYTKNFTCIKPLIREISPIKDFLALISLYKRIKSIKPQIVHTHSSKAGILGRTAAYLAKVPVIVHTVHGFAFSPFHSKFKRNFYILLEKFASKLSDHLIFVSEANRGEAEKLKITKKGKNSIIRSIVGLDKFRKNSLRKNELRKKFGFSEKDKIVGGVFCFKPQKDPVGFIEIANLVIKNSDDIKFIIAGDGYVKSAMIEKIREYKIDDKIIFLGWIDNPDELIPTFDVLLLPSLWEGLPQVVVQAIVSRVPVIATSVNGTKDIVKNGENGFLFEPKNYKKAANLILNIFKSKEIKDKIQAQSEIVYENFNPEIMVREQEKLYLKLLENVKRVHKNKKKFF